MPIEIKLLMRTGRVPEGTYKARYLNEPERGILQNTNPCRKAQIIEGPHSGEIVPYAFYMVVGELPVQAELLQVKEKLVNDLAAAGKKVTEYARKTGMLQEKVELLEEKRQYLGKRIDSLEERNRELHSQLQDICRYVQQRTAFPF